jgi:5-methylcytosine-specific restriction protein A
MPWSSSNRKERLPANWSSLRLFVLERDGYRCQLAYASCIVDATEVDHIEPGDDHRPVNLQAACVPCHRIKSAREGHAAKPKRRRRTEQHPGLR